MNTLYYQGGEERLRQARAYGAGALKFYREAGYRRQQMETLMVLGRVETVSEDYGGAEAMFGQALEAARAAGDAQTMGLAEQGLATAAEAQGKLDAALDHLQRAEAAYRGSGRSGHLAYALAAKAELLYELSKPGGREAMEEAAKLAATNPRLSAMLSLVRAQREAANGNWDEASRQLRIARAAADESAGRRARLDALEAWIEHRASPARAAVLCGKVVKAVESGLALDDRAAATFACAEVVRIAALQAALRDLAASPNQAVARKARFYLSRGDKL
jgi:tetratricopeptide (TPR) repeat protein